VTISQSATTPLTPRRLRRLWLPKAFPAFSGRGLAWFRALWYVALVAAILGLAANAAAFYQREVAPSAAFAAFGLRYGPEIPLRLLSPAGEEAHHSGVAAGDAIVAVNGQAVDDRMHPRQLARLLDAAGAQAVVRLRSADGGISEHRLPRDDGNARSFARSGVSIYALLLSLRIWNTMTGLLLLGTAILLFRLRPHDPVAALLSLSFLVLLASYAWPALEEAGLGALSRPLRATGWTLFALVLLVFPSGRFEPRWTALVVLAFPFTWLYSIVAASELVYGLLGLVLLLAAIPAVAIRYRRMEPSAERQQIKWAVLGFAAGAAALLLGRFLTVGLPLFTHSLWVLVWAEMAFPFLFILMVACFAGGLLVSLLGYRLYDADAAISRSATYAVMTLMMGAVFAASSETMQLMFQASFNRDMGSAAAAIGAGAAAVVVTPAHDRIQRWAERRFQRNLVELRHRLPLLAGDLRETLLFADLLAVVLDRMVAGVRASRAAVLLGGESGWQVAAVRGVAPEAVQLWASAWRPATPAAGLDCGRGDPLFPVRIPLRAMHLPDAEPFAYILLGPRPDGSFYGKDERETLAEVAEPVAQALLIARIRSDREADLRDRLAAVERRVAALDGAAPEATRAPVRHSPSKDRETRR